MVEECAAKVVDELQKTMAFDMARFSLWRIRSSGQCRKGDN